MLVEAFDVPDGFSRHVPIDRREALRDYRLRRLGSAITDKSGEFCLEYDSGGQSISSSPRGQFHINLWVIASIACHEGHELEIVYQSPEVREGASAVECYPICLTEIPVDVINDGRLPRPILTPDSIKKAHEQHKALAGAELDIAKDKFARRFAIRTEFEKAVAPSLRTELSLVELDDNGNPVDPDYVTSRESVRAKAERRLLTALAARFDVDSADKMALSGRIALTDGQREQLDALDNDTGTNAITVDEDNLAAILNGSKGRGKNPEHGAQIVHRVNAIELFCRDKSHGERCLTDERGARHLEGGHGGGSGDEPVELNVAVERPSDRRDLAAGGVSVEMLNEGLPQYIADVLNEASILDQGARSLPAPGTQLTEDLIRAANTFPSLTLPPARPTSQHSTISTTCRSRSNRCGQRLWTNDSLRMQGLSMNATSRGGGSPSAFLSGVITAQPNALGVHFGTAGLIGGLQAVFTLPTPDPLVQQHIDITNEEWGALTSDQQKTLRGIGEKILEQSRASRAGRTGRQRLLEWSDQ